MPWSHSQLEPTLGAAEQARRQGQEAEGSQQHVAEEEAKAARLAQQAEQRAKQEQSRGNLTAAVAASSTAARCAENMYMIFVCTRKIDKTVR